MTIAIVAAAWLAAFVLIAVWTRRRKKPPVPGMHVRCPGMEEQFPGQLWYVESVDDGYAFIKLSAGHCYGHRIPIRFLEY